MLDLALDSMSPKELRELRELVDQAIAIATQREKAELVERMAALAAEHGLSLADITEAPETSPVSEDKPTRQKRTRRVTN